MIKQFSFIFALLLCSVSFAGDVEIYNSTVRVGIQNNFDDGNDYGGTGVVIDIKEDKKIALVLTVAHLFYDEENNKLFDIETTLPWIDSFRYVNRPILTERKNAKLLQLDVPNDVAFIEYKYDRKPGVTGLAEYFPKKTSDYKYRTVGCPNRQFPNLQRAQILCVNDNSNVYGTLDHSKWKSYKVGFYPALGRSGSGLFDKNDKVIGILSWRDDAKYYGVYVAGPTIKEEFDKLNWKNK